MSRNRHRWYIPTAPIERRPDSHTGAMGSIIYSPALKNLWGGMKGSGINLFCYEGRDERTGSTGYFHVWRIPAGPGSAPALVRRRPIPPPHFPGVQYPAVPGGAPGNAGGEKVFGAGGVPEQGGGRKHPEQGDRGPAQGPGGETG